MKRIWSPLLIVAMILGSSLTVQAMQTALTDFGTAEGDVYARFEGNGLYTEESTITDGSGEIVLNDETTLKIEGVSDDVAGVKGLMFPETETELWDWIETCLADDLKSRKILSLTFIDKEGENAKSQTAKVSISVDSENENWVIYGIDANGSVRKLVVDAKNGQVDFTADGSDYYVLAKEKEIPETEEPTTEAPSIEEDGSDTGDEAKPILWMALFVASVAGISFAIVKKRSV